jgi:cellulose synthase operon protein C
MADCRYVGKMLLAASVTWAAALPAWGQPSGPAIREAVVVGEAEGAAVAPPTTLLGRFGVPVAKRLLFTEDRSDRLRGIERLGALGTDEAIEALVNAVEVGTTLGRDPEARLLAVRSLAAHAHRPGVRGVLTRELSDPGKGKSAALTSLADLLRESAALALARSTHRPGGDDEALAALIVAVRQGGLPAEAASRALKAFPPPSIDGILDGFGKSSGAGETAPAKSRGKGGKKQGKKGSSGSKPTGKPADQKAPPQKTAPRKALAPPVIDLLGDLGDLRATARLRAELKRKDQAGQIAAAIALAKLGDVTPAEVARGWIKRPDARLQRSATEVLVRLGTPDAPRAIATLLASDATRAQGVRFALDAPTPALVKALEQALPKLFVEDRPACVEAIGRAGGPSATSKLIALLEDPDLRTPAAFALATSPGDGVSAAMATALAAAPTDADDGAKRRLLARAGIVRALTLDDPPDGLVETLERMLASKRPEDRGAAALGLVALGELDVPAVLAKGDDASIRGAAAGSIAQGPGALESWSPALSSSDAPTPTQTAAGVALLSDEALSSLPTSWLLRRAEEGGALSPLAARALAIRDDEPLRPQIARLLGGTDPVVRAHVALGLGQSHEPDAVSVLAAAYRFEPDAAVRRAVVRGLSARSEVQRLHTLRLARDLDPDSTVRSLARAALAGRRFDAVPAMAGRYVGWIELVPNEASASPLTSDRAALVVRGDGVGIPVVASDDGVLLVPGLGLGAGSVRLAPASAPGDASPP